MINKPEKRLLKDCDRLIEQIDNLEDTMWNEVSDAWQSYVDGIVGELESIKPKEYDSIQAVVPVYKIDNLIQQIQCPTAREGCQ